MASVPAPMHSYTYQLYSPADGTSIMGKTDAAYFVEEGAFTLFKDSGHAVVLAVRTDFLVMVERGARDD